MAAIVVGLFTLLVYVVTLAPSVAGGDSGELTTAAYTLGIAHPPGYPLYLLLGKVFTWIPVGSIAWRMNFFSAVCDAATAGILCWLVEKLSKDRIAALSTACLFAFSAIVWRYAVVAEVFALNNLLCAGLVALYVLYRETRDIRYVYGGAFLSGLALCNHHLAIFFIVPFAVWVLADGHAGLLKWRPAGKLVGLFALGLTPYLYLPLRSGAQPILSWGDQTTILGFLTHLLRIEYGTFRLASEEIAEKGSTSVHALKYSWRLALDFLIIGLPLLYFGIRRAMKHRLFGVTPLIAVAMFLVCFFGLANLDSTDPLYLAIQSRFWQQPAFVLFLCFGLGLAALREPLTKLRPWAFRAACGSLVLVQLTLGLVYENQRRELTFYRYSRMMLADLPKDVLLLTCGDVVSNSVRYTQLAEHFRPDVLSVDVMLLKHEWYRKWMAKHRPAVRLPAQDFSLTKMLDENQHLPGIFAAGELCDPAGHREAFAKYWQWQTGCAVRVLPRDRSPSLASLAEASKKELYRCMPVEKPESYDHGSWEWNVDHAMWKVRADILDDAMATANRTQDWTALPALVELMERAAREFPRPWPKLYKDIAYSLYNLSKRDSNYYAAARTAMQKYISLSDPNDPDTIQFREILGK